MSAYTLFVGRLPRRERFVTWAVGAACGTLAAAASFHFDVAWPLGVLPFAIIFTIGLLVTGAWSPSPPVAALTSAAVGLVMGQALAEYSLFAFDAKTMLFRLVLLASIASLCQLMIWAGTYIRLMTFGVRILGGWIAAAAALLSAFYV